MEDYIEIARSADVMLALLLNRKIEIRMQLNTSCRISGKLKYGTDIMQFTCRCYVARHLSLSVSSSELFISDEWPDLAMQLMRWFPGLHRIST
jgi:hypothetical protein